MLIFRCKMTEHVQIQQEEYTEPLIENGRFKNPWDTWTDPTAFNLIKYRCSTWDTSAIPKTEEVHVMLYTLHNNGLM